MSIENKTPDTVVEPAVDLAATPSTKSAEADRHYEQTGLYPEGGKAFRLYALLGWLLGVIVFIAACAAALDRILL